MEENYFISILAILIFVLSCQKVNIDCNINDYPNAPAVDWNTEVDGSGEESHGHHILSCSDGGFLQIGKTGFIPNSEKILVVKTDENGTLIWKKEFGNSGNNLGNSAVETSNGYIIFGTLNENSTLIKLNKSDGSEKFIKSIDKGENEAFEHIILTSTGILSVGDINAEDNANTFHTEGEGYITFLDSNGVKKNRININQFLAQGYRIVSLNNKFYISGLTESASDHGLIKMDSIENVTWNKKYGENSADHSFGMDMGDDRYISITGHTLSATEKWDTYTMKFDSSGNQIWEIKAGKSRGFKPNFFDDESWRVKSTSDGGAILSLDNGKFSFIKIESF